MRGHRRESLLQARDLGAELSFVLLVAPQALVNPFQLGLQFQAAHCTRRSFGAPLGGSGRQRLFELPDFLSEAG